MNSKTIQHGVDTNEVNKLINLLVCM